MQTSIPRPHVLFIDGLPGSSKSTAAEAVGGYLSNSRVFAETAPNHPLLVAAPDQMGAAFADIHERHSADSFAAAALGRLESFLESAGCDVLYVFESHPIQSSVNLGRTSYSFKTVSSANIASNSILKIEVKNIILVALRSLEFSHGLDP
jgi:hypothetical protein